METATTVDGHELARLYANWQAEKESVLLYEVLAALQTDPLERDMWRTLAASERSHAQFWQQRLAALGEAVPAFHPRPRTRLLIRLAHWFGPAFIIPSITWRELHDVDDYLRQPDAQDAGLAREEQAHANLLRSRSTTAFGNNLRASVLGANDGLASNFCLMMGVAGAGAHAPTVMLAGIAGLIGGACSMALGEWLSVTNARELAQSHLEAMPRAAARDRTHATVAAAPDAVQAAALSFGLFAVGAAVPLLPYCILQPPAAVWGSIIASLAALWAVGVTTTLFNGRSAWFSGLRQIVIGAAAAAVTYLSGTLLGALSR